MRDFSGDIAVVVAEHAAEAIATGDFSFDFPDLYALLDKIIAESLMIAFTVIVRHELGQGAT